MLRLFKEDQRPILLFNLVLMAVVTATAPNGFALVPWINGFAWVPWIIGSVMAALKIFVVVSCGGLVLLWKRANLEPEKKGLFLFVILYALDTTNKGVILSWAFMITLIMYLQLHWTGLFFIECAIFGVCYAVSLLPMVRAAEILLRRR